MAAELKNNSKLITHVFFLMSSKATHAAAKQRRMISGGIPSMSGLAIDGNSNVHQSLAVQFHCTEILEVFPSQSSDRESRSIGM